jgi:hypothetical protein
MSLVEYEFELGGIQHAAVGTEKATADIGKLIASAETLVRYSDSQLQHVTFLEEAMRRGVSVHILLDYLLYRPDQVNADFIRLNDAGAEMRFIKGVLDGSQISVDRRHVLVTKPPAARMRRSQFVLYDTDAGKLADNTFDQLWVSALPLKR